MEQINLKDYFNDISFYRKHLYNDLSLKEINVSFGQKIKLLALNGTILPNQCAIKYEKPNQWGIQKVWVCFEVDAGGGKIDSKTNDIGCDFNEYGYNERIKKNE